MTPCLANDSDVNGPNYNVQKMSREKGGGHMATPEDVKRADRQFRDKAADVLRSDSKDFGHKLKVLMHFLHQNEVAWPIIQPYFERDAGLMEWQRREGGHRGLGRAAGLDLPIDDDERLALILQLLQAIADGKIDVLHIAMAVSYESKFDDLIRSFNDKFTRLAVRDIGDRLREMLPPAPVAGGTVIQTGAGSTSTIAVGSNIRQSVTVENPDLASVIAEMRDFITFKSEFSPTEKAELADEIDILEREGRRSVPRAEILLTVLQSLAAIPGLVDLAGRAAELLHVAW